jgi:Ca2+-binding EF-hand superfamily protein
MTRNISLAALMTAAALLAPVAHAVDLAESRLEALFKKADTNNDGTLTKEEAKAMPRVLKNFDAIDTDKDGTVSLDEIRAAMAKARKGGKDMHAQAVERFKAADKDNDGTLTKEEAKAMPKVAKNFDAIDADKDGTVSEQEVHDFMKAQQSKK